MPNFTGPADHLVYEGQTIPRGQMVHASGKDLERLKALGHTFEGHAQTTGPAFVDQPQPATVAMGAHGGPISPAEVLASSSEHVAAQHEAAVAEQQPVRERAAAREESAKR